MKHSSVIINFGMICTIVMGVIVIPPPPLKLSNYVRLQQQPIEPSSSSLPFVLSRLRAYTHPSIRHKGTTNDEEGDIITTNNYSNNNNNNNNRREWMTQTTKWGIATAASYPATALLQQPPPAVATTPTATLPMSSTKKSTSSLCDPSVSTLTKNK